MCTYEALQAFQRQILPQQSSAICFQSCFLHPLVPSFHSSTCSSISLTYLSHSSNMITSIN